MASQAATLMGSTLPALRIAAAPVASSARVAASPVRAALDVKVLQSKSLGELRQLAKERGMRGDTKAELVKLLTSSYASSPASNGAAAAKAPAAVNPQYKKQLEAMPMAQLRAVAHTKGIYGGSKPELVAALLAAGSAPAAAAPSAPAYANGAVSAAPVAAAPATSDLARQLQTKPIAVLRAMARQKGLRGTTKDELVSALVAAAPASAFAAPAAASPPPAASTAAAASAPAATASAAAVNVNPQTLARQLQARPLSALRAMANAKGISGAAAPKDQLIRALVAAATATAANVTEVKAAASVRAAELQSKPLSELRTIARAKGIRGDTKAELVKLLTAEEARLPPLQSTYTIGIPFQSDLPAGGTTAIAPLQPSSLGVQSAAMSEAMELLLGRVEGAPEDSVAEQSAFLRNVLVAGIGVAMLPLMLPGQMASTGGSAPAGTAPQVVVPPPAEPAPEVRELSPEEFCTSLPASLLSPQAAKFCQAVKDIGL